MGKKHVTQLLLKLKKNKEEIYDQLYPLIYDELRQLAYSHISRDPSAKTLSKTELVHETYLRMIDQSAIDFKDKSHFLAIASRCMRQILIDYARKKHAKKRGGRNSNLTYIDELFSSGDEITNELLGIDEALDDLEKLNPRLCQIVEMRFFGEMSIEETAEALDISRSTVKRDWMKARGWLYKELKGIFKSDNLS